MKPEFYEPESYSEAAELLSLHGSDARVLAGGTALVLMLRQGLVQPAVLVSLGRIRSNRAIELRKDGLHIDALASLRSVERSPEARLFCPALAGCFREVGNVRVRNQATVGGNLAEADYASDPPAMFLALNAGVTTTSRAGSREIPIEHFFQGFFTTALEPDEVLTGVRIPTLPHDAGAVYLKYRSRAAEDRPCVGVAAVAVRDEAGVCLDMRIAIGAAVETPRRLHEVENIAAGQTLTREVIDEIAEGYSAGIEDVLEDQRGSAWYRRRMIRVLVRRALEEVRDGHR